MIGQTPENPNARHHAANSHCRPYTGFRQAEAKLFGEKIWHPNHNAVITEVLYGGKDDHAQTDFGGGFIFH